MFRACIHIFFFFNDTATTEIYTLSLHDALPISRAHGLAATGRFSRPARTSHRRMTPLSFIVARSLPSGLRSEEHTSELQSQSNLVCRLLLEKKKNKHSAAVYRPNQLLMC